MRNAGQQEKADGRAFRLPDDGQLPAEEKI
jgi:hypothetical protein